MYESLRGHRDFASFPGAVLKSAALAALAAGLSLPAFGQNGTTPGATTGTGTTTGTTTGAAAVAAAGPSALFCTVPSSLPSALGATAVPTVTPAGTTGASTITAIPVVTGSLIPGINGTTLSCGAFGGAQSLQNLSFTAEGVVPIDFVLSPTAPVLPTETFAGLIAGTTQLRDVASLSGNTMTISLFSVPATAAFPTLMIAPATTVTPPGSLITQMTMQVSNVIITHGPASTMLFSGIVNPTATSTTSGTTTGATTATTSGTALVPNLFNISSPGAASLSLAFGSGFTFPGLGATSATPNPGPFGLIGQTPSQTMMATMLTVTVAGDVTFASPANFVTMNTPATPAAFQTTTTSTTAGATTGTGTGSGGAF
jgi:hypothetical protein